MNLPLDQIVYVLLLLPALFSLAFLSEGLHKVLKGESRGIINILFGAVVLAGSFLIYYVASESMKLPK